MVDSAGLLTDVVVVLGQVLKLPGPMKSVMLLSAACDSWLKARTVLAQLDCTPTALRSMPPSTNCVAGTLPLAQTQPPHASSKVPFSASCTESAGGVGWVT